MENPLKANQFTQAYQEAADKVESWAVGLIKMLPDLVVAVIILIFFYLLSRLVRSALSKLFTRLTSNNASIIRLMSKFGQFVVNCIGLLLALGVLNLDKTLTSLLAGAGVIGLALGFAFKEILTDYISGTMIAVRQPYVPGEIIDTNGIFARVKSLNLRATVLETLDGQMIVIPNSEIFSRPITNYTRLGKRRVVIDVGVSYDSDLPTVKEVARELVESFDFVLEDPKTAFNFLDFNDSSIHLQIRFWVKYPGPHDFFEVRSMVIEKIHSTFKEKGIVIPFPIRTLDFKHTDKKALGTMGF